MDVVVPFDAREPKTRLSSLLGPDERQAFARAMLTDVCDAIEATGREPTVLATADVDCAWPITVDDSPLTETVNDVLDTATEPVAVVMADLALATPEALQRVFSASGEVVLVPGRGGGTNVVLTRHPDFRVDYHGVSIRDHRRRAAEIGVEPTIVDSFWLASDIDIPEDVVDLLVHRDGNATEWIEQNVMQAPLTDDQRSMFQDLR